MEQNHLNHKDTVNLGSYYTPQWLVDIVYSLLEKNAPNLRGYYILDTSCGYGGFLRGGKSIGADIDKKAVETAKSAAPASIFFNHNSLSKISRAQYGLDKNAKIIIVGNPPYNDTT
jgi:predicted RNA methylase